MAKKKVLESYALYNQTYNYYEGPYKSLAAAEKALGKVEDAKWVLVKMTAIAKYTVEKPKPQDNVIIMTEEY